MILAVVLPKRSPAVGFALVQGAEVADRVGAFDAQRMPLCLRRRPTTVLQAASTGPEPICQPWAR